MGLMDKVKAQATQLAEQTRQAAEQGKAKLDQAQANRRGDQMLRQLGVLVLADRTGRGAPDGQAKIDQLVNDISAYERENGLNLTAEPAAQSGVPQQPNPFAGPPQGGPPSGGQPQGGGAAPGRRPGSWRRRRAGARRVRIRPVVLPRPGLGTSVRLTVRRPTARWPTARRTRRRPTARPGPA